MRITGVRWGQKRGEADSLPVVVTWGTHIFRGEEEPVQRNTQAAPQRRQQQTAIDAIGAADCAQGLSGEEKEEARAEGDDDTGKTPRGGA